MVATSVYDLIAGIAFVPAGPPGLLRWLDPLIDNGHVTEMLIAIASVSVVVWTAGFVVRSFGHRPGRGLVAGMNYAQLAFMGGLVEVVTIIGDIRLAA